MITNDMHRQEIADAFHKMRIRGPRFGKLMKLLDNLIAQGDDMELFIDHINETTFCKTNGLKPSETPATPNTPATNGETN